MPHILPDNSLKAMVTDRIREAIVTGRYKPGIHLVEQALAEEIGISRGPVREALQQLQQEGLVHLSPRRGCVVTTLSPVQAAEIYTLRGHLESLAVRLNRPHWTSLDTAYLQEVVQEMERLGPEDWQAAIDLDLRFHHYIVAACRNQSLIQMYWSIDAKVAACFLAVKHHLNNHVDQMAIRHETLVDVLRQGDFWRAEFLAAEHWADTAARFRALVAE
jgi:DNA-binding GntR family transcriptional regulator